MSSKYSKKLEKYQWKKRRIPNNPSRTCTVIPNEFSRDIRKGSTSTSSSTRVMNSTSTNKLKSHVLLSIVEGRGQSNGEIGIATIDIYSANVELSQFRDTSSYSRTLVKLLVYYPAEILLPRSGLEPNSCMRKLVKLLQSLHSGATLNGVNRNHFNDKQGLHYLRRLCHPQYIPSIYAIKEKFYALSALSGLLNYAEEIHGLIYAPKSMKFSFTGSVKSTMIDVKSAKHLHLVKNSYDYSAKDTLYAALDFTCTASGARLLRTNLLEPPCDLPTILNRQASVRELISSPDTLFNIQNVLRQFPHIDNLLSLCVQICSSSSIFNQYNNTDQSNNETPQINEINHNKINSKTDPFSRDKSDELLINTNKICTQIINNESILISTVKKKSTDSLFDKPIKTSTSNSMFPPLQPTSSSFITHSSGKVFTGRNEVFLIKKAASIQAAESRITKVIAIKYMLDLVKLLHNAMGNVNSPLLRTYKELLQDSEYEQVLQTLCTVLHKDVRLSRGMLAMRTQKCFAIKEGLSVVLDVTRKAYSEQLDDITKEVSRLARLYNLPLRISHNKSHCHSSSSANGVDFCNENIFLEEEDEEANQEIMPMCTTSENNINNNTYNMNLRTPKQNDPLLQNLPDDFIKPVITKGIVQCTTDFLIRLNERMKGSLYEVYHIADQIICDLITRLHPDMALFYRLCEVIAGLDLIASFANMSISCSLKNNFACPIFSDTLGIRNGRNIVTEQEQKSPCIPNHTYASPDSNFHIITGPPMSGKTTYLRQIAYIQIIAQIGCFVPAEFAAIRIADQIFFHTGGQDDIVLGESSFTNEVRELTYILRNFSRSSIILIDGLCQNTNPGEVEFLNTAICEAFLEHKSKLLVSFKIKFLQNFLLLGIHIPGNQSYELTSLAYFYPNVENYYFLVHEELTNGDYGNDTTTINHTIDEKSINNSSKVLMESPLVHSFSDRNDPNKSTVHDWRNDYVSNNRLTSSQITFTYKLIKGKSPKVMFGIKLARLTAIPREVLDRAEDLLKAYLAEQNDGRDEENRKTMLELREGQKEALRNQDYKTDLDASSSSSSPCCLHYITSNKDLEKDKDNMNWQDNKITGHLSTTDRLEHELFRQLQIIFKAYQKLNTIQYLSDSEKDHIQNEMINYLEFLKLRYNTLLSKSNIVEE
ncbi:unnamed protein product [Heterobilharzia americana]|nr:unnamed protein product [Heterobilharzia americana]